LIIFVPDPMIQPRAPRTLSWTSVSACDWTGVQEFPTGKRVKI
jgi:hypothetical protein